MEAVALEAVEVEVEAVALEALVLEVVVPGVTSVVIKSSMHSWITVATSVSDGRVVRALHQFECVEVTMRCKHCFQEESV